MKRRAFWGTVGLLLISLQIFLSAEESSSDDLTHWRQVLRFGIEDEVLELTKSLTRNRDGRLNEELVALLNETDPTLRKEISIAIFQLFALQNWKKGQPLALSLLVRSTEGEIIDPILLEGAINYLGITKSDEATEPLMQLLEREETRVVLSALMALAKIGKPAAGEMILKHWEEGTFEEQVVREQALLALGELKAEAATDVLLEVADDPSLPAMERNFAYEALGKIGDSRALSFLESHLGSAKSLTRSYILAGISYFEDEKVSVVLQRALRDSYWKVRVAAMEGLSKRGVSEAVPAIIYKARHDPEEKVKIAALKALGSLAETQESREFLLNFYGDSNNSLNLRLAAIEALLEARVTDVIPLIEEVLRGDDPNGSVLMEKTAQKIAKTQWSDLQQLFEKMLDHPSSTIRVYAAEGILNNKTTSAISLLKSHYPNEKNPLAKSTIKRTLEALESGEKQEPDS